jgi:hypothetical protein
MIPRIVLSYWANQGIKFWLGAEVLFYLYYQINRRRLQVWTHTPLPSIKERASLFKRCLAAYDDIAKVDVFEKVEPHLGRSGSMKDLQEMNRSTNVEELVRLWHNENAQRSMRQPSLGGRSVSGPAAISSPRETELVHSTPAVEGSVVGEAAAQGKERELVQDGIDGDSAVVDAKAFIAARERALKVCTSASMCHPAQHVD